MTFSDTERAACRQLIHLALAEDLGPVGDVTLQALLTHQGVGSAVFIARSTGVLAGLEAVALTFATIDPSIRFERLRDDGISLAKGEHAARASGLLQSLLLGERTALNFVQRMSGVATMTRHFVDAIAGTQAMIVDTRKTTPGFRRLEKYAVRCGGGHNHRVGLFDMILIKDNHLVALRIADPAAAVAEAIRRARVYRESHDPSMSIMIEVESLPQLDAALAGRPDFVLLDNMPLADMKESVRRRATSAPGVQLEASGGVTLATVRAIAETGVDRISVGALTHSAPAWDLALDFEP
ncbi:MAG TPA: carboxylating nicotinate-nucleotide diphosphorylase [Gemmataceae bacterium]|jgi:nicotinate-nucleotide pyrophosphorylase (carboxylating)|nr:carboxylating nicotinate-nucleotide diphosphorylase [Gemmataceae bacterium]